MWFVYILYSATVDRYYVGYTADVASRLRQHNDGWGRYTKRGIPWKVVYTEQVPTKRTAIQREREIKRQKDRRYIETLIDS